MRPENIRILRIRNTGAERFYSFFTLTSHPTVEAVPVFNMVNLKCRRFAGGEVFAECLSVSQEARCSRSVFTTLPESNVVFSQEARCSRNVSLTLAESNVVVSQEARCSRSVSPTLPESNVVVSQEARCSRNVFRTLPCLCSPPTATSSMAGILPPSARFPQV